jgi:S1-C subfamily serine protease
MPRYRALLGAAFTLQLGGCAGSDASSPAPAACLSLPYELQVFGGQAAAALESLPAKQRSAVVGVSVAGRGLCSGVIVAEGKALTAKHCVDFPEKPAIELMFGESLETPRATAAARVVRRHEELDIALLELETPGALSGEIVPLALFSEAMDASWVGATVQVMGYGFTETGDLGELRFTEEIVTALDEQFVVVDGFGERGACSGDSGGPLLAMDARGALRVAGVLDQGSASCVGKDYFTRADRIAAWAGPDLTTRNSPACLGED